MDDVAIFLFHAVLVIFFGSRGILKWYRQREAQEMKALDFKVIAAENETITYHEKGNSLLKHLERLKLTPEPSTKIKNVLLSTYGSQKISIFESTYICDSGKSSETVDLLGILIEFESIWFPRFVLKPKKSPDWYDNHSGLKRVYAQMMPAWLRPDFSLFYITQRNPEETATLFIGKERLNSYLKSSEFHKLCGCHNYLVFYKKGTLESSIKGYHYVEYKAHQLVHVFTQPHEIIDDSDVSQAIKFLKRHEQN